MPDRTSPSGTYRNIPGETTRGPTGTDDDRSSSSPIDMDQTSPSGTYQNIPGEPTRPTSETEDDTDDDRESPIGLTTSPSGTYRNIPGETTHGPTGADADERELGPTTSPSGTYRNIPGETTRGPARHGEDETRRAYARELGDRLEPRLRLGQFDPETQDPTTPESRAAIERTLGLGSGPDTAPSTARYGATTTETTPTILDADDVYTAGGTFGLTSEGTRAIEEAAGERVASTAPRGSPFGSEDLSATLSTGGGLTVDVSDDARERELLEQLREGNPDLDIQRDDVTFEETEDGGLRAEFTGEVPSGGESTREGFFGSRLQSASNWWQSGADTVGETVEDVTPGADVTLYTFASGGRSVPLETGEQADEVLGGASETILSTIDPAGAALGARDLTVALSDEYEGWQDYQYEQSQDVGARDLLDRPGAVADALFGAGYLEERGAAATLAARETAPEVGRSFVESPTESTLGGTGSILAGFGTGTAAVRGGRLAGRGLRSGAGRGAPLVADRADDLTTSFGEFRQRTPDVSLERRPDLEGRVDIDDALAEDIREYAESVRDLPRRGRERLDAARRASEADPLEGGMPDPWIGALEGGQLSAQAAIRRGGERLARARRASEADPLEGGSGVRALQGATLTAENVAYRTQRLLDAFDREAVGDAAYRFGGRTRQRARSARAEARYGLSTLSPDWDAINDSAFRAGYRTQQDIDRANTQVATNLDRTFADYGAEVDRLTDSVPTREGIGESISGVSSRGGSGLDDTLEDLGTEAGRMRNVSFPDAEDLLGAGARRTTQAGGSLDRTLGDYGAEVDRLTDLFPTREGIAESASGVFSRAGTGLDDTLEDLGTETSRMRESALGLRDLTVRVDSPRDSGRDVFDVPDQPSTAPDLPESFPSGDATSGSGPVAALRARETPATSATATESRAGAFGRGDATAGGAFTLGAFSGGEADAGAFWDGVYSDAPSSLASDVDLGPELDAGGALDFDAGGVFGTDESALTGEVGRTGQDSGVTDYVASDLITDESATRRTAQRPWDPAGGEGGSPLFPTPWLDGDDAGDTSSSFFTNEDEALWETGFADAEDVLEGGFGWGTESEESEIGFGSELDDLDRLL